MNETSLPKKALGQHWLFDEPTLRSLIKAGELKPSDTVLEIGSGLGTLTTLLVKEVSQVIAIEKDSSLASELARTKLASNLEVVEGDILTFDLGKLPHDYKIVANIPYYLTSNLLRRLLEGQQVPSLMALMVQKEVAERISAKPGQMSLLAFSVQYYAQAKYIQSVPKELFTPPPQVDSAIIQLRRRPRPAFAADRATLFRMVKAGFAGKRKQLKNSLAAGLRSTPALITAALESVDIDATKRAQELSLADWQRAHTALAAISS